MKYQHIFDTSQLQDDLKKRSLKSGAITLTSQGLQFVIQLTSTMILARILSPADYGINAMAMAVTGFAGIFLSLGLSTATVQRSDITHEQVSTLFWINAAIGLLITMVVAAMSPVVAWFYKAPEMKNVMLALSTMFFISGLAVQHAALLTRQMRFLSQSVINITALIGGIVIAIVTAKSGWGYWALIFNSLANITIVTVGNWVVCRWIPGLPVRSVGVGSMIRFGADLAGFNFVNYFSRNLDNVLIGRYIGSTALGLYSKAYQLLMMPITNLRDPLTKVALPVLSRLQHEPDQYKEYYLKCVSLLAFVSMPLVVFMFVCSDQLIELLLGTRWLGASDIFKVLAVAALFQPVSGTTGMVFISMGRSRPYLVIGTVNAVLISVSFLVGLPWGAKGVATSYAIFNYLILVPNVHYAFRGTQLKVNDFIRAICKPLSASTIMGGGCFVLLKLINHMHVLTVLSAIFSFASALYLLMYMAVSGGLKDLQEYFSYGKLIINRK